MCALFTRKCILCRKQKSLVDNNYTHSSCVCAYGFLVPKTDERECECFVWFLFWSRKTFCYARAIFIIPLANLCGQCENNWERSVTKWIIKSEMCFWFVLTGKNDFPEEIFKSIFFETAWQKNYIKKYIERNTLARTYSRHTYKVLAHNKVAQC